MGLAEITIAFLRWTRFLTIKRFQGFRISRILSRGRICTAKSSDELAAARDAVKQLCASGKCDSVTFSVYYTSDIAKFLNTGIAPHGDGRPVQGYDSRMNLRVFSEDSTNSIHIPRKWTARSATNNGEGGKCRRCTLLRALCTI